MTEKGLEVIKRHEGLRLLAYLCPAGVLTIGYGHTKDVKVGSHITVEMAELMLLYDIEIAEKDVRSLVYNYELISPVRQDALVNLCFNLGKTRLSKFRNFLNNVRLENWKQAGSDLVRSLWYKQVGRRGLDVVMAITEGTWD